MIITMLHHKSLHISNINHAKIAFSKSEETKICCFSRGYSTRKNIFLELLDHAKLFYNTLKSLLLQGPGVGKETPAARICSRFSFYKGKIYSAFSLFLEPDPSSLRFFFLFVGISFLLLFSRLQ